MAADRGNVVLEEEIDENYEPTEQEVKDYAEWLGMDMDADSELLWIAREALRAPLPEPWKTCQSADLEIFYFNFETGESVWDHPVDEHYRALFEEEKLKANAPKRVVTLDVTPQTDGSLQVSCTNLGGSEIGMVSLGPKKTLEKLAQQLGRQLELSKQDRQQFRFVLTDGRLLTDSDQFLSLGEIFGVVSSQDDRLKSKAISALKDAEVHKKGKKKDKQNRRKTCEEFKDSSISESPCHDKVRRVLGPLPPLKLDAKRTRIAKLQKSGSLELSRLVGDGLVDVMNTEKVETPT
eukprot:gnl/MRDRNA2_/MRDRNA2_91678_c0_seq1.p1 gnl/MRDRNA2_/MRDRNA2_91678_c0~~gnl/MRDRNA2_/MRDRNA2_91678_c0_seq1.p1  ORF type:complete len:293 (-),score=75.21 gnl/MRDRNA2_/MRDRNA2_91678_c0_seq1:140-1018(-)